MKGVQSLDEVINAAKSTVVSTILDLVGVNYTVIDVDGSYVHQNGSMINSISKGLVNAAEIDLPSWENCQLIMQDGKRVLKEEPFGNKHYLTVKQPIIQGNKCLGIVCLSIDITAQKKAEDAKAEFLRNINHDIRTPLVGIYTLSKLLHNDETDSAKKSWLADLVTSSERLSLLLDQVLELTNLGNCPIEYKDHNIKDVIDEVTCLMISAIKAKGLELHTNISSRFVNTDKLRLSRIVLNLLSNAVKFTPQGAICITAERKPKLMVTVEDTGIGIPKDKFEFIFEKFTKLKQSGESQGFTGSGIGLYMARQMAKEIGGDILVQSELGKGSIFSFVQT